MTSPVSAVEDIEQAMEGVTHSDWFMSPWHVEEDASAVRNKLDGSYICNASSDRFAAYIASCNPVAIREVLALARQAEALQQEVDSLEKTRQHSREASAALHDAYMAEKKRAEALQRENAELRSFASSFKLTCVERSFYKDCYLHISEPDSVSFRLGNGSQFSKFIAGLEDRRARALLGGENAE